MLVMTALLALLLLSQVVEAPRSSADQHKWWLKPEYSRPVRPPEPPPPPLKNPPKNRKCVEERLREYEKKLQDATERCRKFRNSHACVREYDLEEKLLAGVHQCRTLEAKANPKPKQTK